MSTHCVVTIFNTDPEAEFHVYRRMDGYPHGAYGVIAELFAARIFAWDLPRFEASDFAAACIAAWKRPGGGNIYMTGGPQDHGDLAYVYRVSAKRIVVSSVGVSKHVVFDGTWEDALLKF